MWYIYSYIQGTHLHSSLLVGLSLVGWSHLQYLKHWEGYSPEERTQYQPGQYVSLKYSTALIQSIMLSIPRVALQYGHLTYISGGMVGFVLSCPMTCKSNTTLVASMNPESVPNLICTCFSLYSLTLCI